MLRVAVISVFILACGSSRGTTPGAGQGGTATARKGSIAVDTDRFPHGVHTGDKPDIKNWQGRGLQCFDCHSAEAVVAGKVARPGANQHAPCDDCHKAEFFKPPGILCRVCHKTVDPFKPHDPATGWEKNADLQPYPERGGTQTLAATFSHELHLADGKMEAATGAHVGCADCHERNEKTRDPQVPGHRNCIRCHEQSPKVKAVLGMGKCDGCHPKQVELTRGRRFITTDLQFAHATHEKDKGGNNIGCETCHDGVRDSATRADMAIPKMEVCAQCHEDSSKTPDKVRMDQCGVCHAAGADLSSAPPNHGTGGGSKGGARPPDHTLAFRKHHGEQAAAKDAPCRRCHTELQGAKEDSCFQCHQLMRPRDHNLIWRNDHGRDAQMDATRCANCHAPESCAGCHAIAPRSHTPIGDFRNGGHAEQARFNLSSCMTCHTFQTTCSSCHRGTR